MNQGKSQLVADYIAYYVRELVDQKEEAFLAITDVDTDAFRDKMPVVEGCVLVPVSPDDYFDAVRYRNDGKVKRLILLSMDSVQRIDSLKDFVECPVLPSDKVLLWKILKKVLKVSQSDSTLEDFVYILVQNVPMEVGDLLAYLEECILQSRAGRSFSRRKLNDEVSRFGIWRTKGADLDKKDLKRWIRYSNPDLVRRRLEKALESGNLEGESLRKRVVTALGKDDLEKLFNTVEFKEVEDFFRYKRLPQKRGKEPEQEERVYGYSYDKLLKENYSDIYSTEEDIRADYSGENGKTDEIREQNNEQEDVGPFEDARKAFTLDEDELEQQRERIVELQSAVEDYAISDERKEKWREYLAKLLLEYDRAVQEDFVRITPVLLSTYCDKQEKFISVYFEILAWLLADEAMNYLCDNTELVDKLQCLFCKSENGKIEMPFYHPVAGLYFLRLKKLYEIAVQDAESQELTEDIPAFMTEQEKLWFPIRFLQEKHRLYQLDYTSLRNPGRIVFYEKNNRVTNSPVNFRLLNNVIEEYILQNPYLGKLYVGIVDLDDFQGLPLLLHRLQRLVKREECLLSRITIQIVSLRERELRRELRRLYEMGMETPDIYFRFTGGQYIKDDRELELERIMEKCDLLLFADTGVIYNAERLVRYTEKPNEVKRHLAKFDLQEQLGFFTEGKNHIELLWDTLQRIQNGGEAILSKWSNQELNLQKLKEISSKVLADRHFEAAVISTNERLLRHVYREPHYYIRKSRVSGNVSLILTLSQQNKKQELEKTGKNDVEISMSRILDELSGKEEFCKRMLEIDSLLEVFFHISYSGGQLRLRFVAETSEADLSFTEDDKRKFAQFGKELTLYFLTGKNYLADRFREMILNELYGKVRDYTMAMALYQLEHYGITFMEPDMEIREAKKGKIFSYGSTDVMELLELLDFFQRLEEVDESAVTRFQEYYRDEMLAGVLDIAESEKLLNEKMRGNMRILYERVRK